MDNNLSEPAQAELHLAQGLKLKAEQDTDGALREFRKAILLNPALFEAQYETGLACKEKAKVDTFFIRHAFDAFQKAARLNLTHEGAHDQYALIAQRTGKLDELLLEYDAWIKLNPGNELLPRIKKRIISISMAMIPEKVNVAEVNASGALRKTVLFASIATVLLGIGMLLAPEIFTKMFKNFDTAMLKQLVWVGGTTIALGLAGLMGFTQMK